MSPDHDIWIAPDLLFLDGERCPGMVLQLRGGRVNSVCARAKVPAGTVLVPVVGTISPGYVDLQVNGGGGVLLNLSPTVAGLQAIAAAHRRLGTVAILPTLLTDAPEVLDDAADAVLEAAGQGGIIGLHVEGPHIAASRRGIHAPRFIRPLDGRTLAVVRRLRDAAVPVLITLAPETVAPGQIAALVAMGAVVSIGHSDATAAAVGAALAEGASCFTHLFNAMSPLLPRAPGVVGAALNADAHASIICDGIHVADEVIGLALRARPVPDRMFLVSDAMPTVGGPDRFRLYDMDLHLQHGRLVNAEGTLAGAHVTMAQAVARLIAAVGVPPAQALRMAVTVPAAVIGLPDLGRCAGRLAADLIVLDAGWQVQGTLADLLAR
jgi:N-acetylglucosamine-6-phosphate deacetylase